MVQAAINLKMVHDGDKLGDADTDFIETPNSHEQDRRSIDAIAIGL